jgi:hypothetical protein
MNGLLCRVVGFPDRAETINGAHSFRKSRTTQLETNDPTSKNDVQPKVILPGVFSSLRPGFRMQSVPKDALD